MKVICDVCGTTFPETATHCPICGCAKSSSAQTVVGEEMPANRERSTANTYARGGRFAKSNVKQNNRSRSAGGRFSDNRNRQNDTQDNNKGLIAVVLILLLAIILVVVYIGVKVFINDFGNDSNPNDGSYSTGAGQNGSDDQNGQKIPCTALTLNSKFVELKAVNEQYLLAVVKEPDNTTDTLEFVSSDPSIVTVDGNGLLKPVGYGQVTITVTCGSVSEQCTVISTVGTPPASSQPDTQGPTAPAGFVLKLITYKDSGEITISGEGGSTVLYRETNGVKASDITWTTSDPAVATVENGKVVGVDRGTCTITATIGDQTATCYVRCVFDKAPDTPYVLNYTDVTLKNKESISLELKDKETGAKAQNVEWTASVEGAVDINGGKITGGKVSKLTKVVISTEYEGYTYSCTVYVTAS